MEAIISLIFNLLKPLLSDLISKAIRAEFERRFPEEDVYISKKEAALIMHCHVNTIDNRIKQGYLQKFHNGGKVQLLEREVRAFIEGSKPKYT